MSEPMNDLTHDAPRADRCPDQSYTEMLAGDTRPVPECLIAESNQDLGDAPLDPPDPESDYDPAERLDWHLGEIEHYGADDEDEDEVIEAEEAPASSDAGSPDAGSAGAEAAPPDFPAR